MSKRFHFGSLGWPVAKKYTPDEWSYKHPMHMLHVLTPIYDKTYLKVYICRVLADFESRNFPLQAVV